MIQLRILFLVALLLSLGQQSTRADTARNPAPSDDWYGQSLDWTIEEYPGLRNVPESRIQWMANSYDRTHSQVLADLERQAQTMSPVLITPPGAQPAAPIKIPASSWNRDVVLDPSYQRVLENAIAKYQGVAFVPEESVIWLARTWNRPARQVKFDLQRVQRADPDQMRQEGFPH